jgi:hypothetical protein
MREKSGTLAGLGEPLQVQVAGRDEYARGFVARARPQPAPPNVSVDGAGEEGLALGETNHRLVAPEQRELGHAGALRRRLRGKRVWTSRPFR